MAMAGEWMLDPAGWVQLVPQLAVIIAGAVLVSRLLVSLWLCGVDLGWMLRIVACVEMVLMWFLLE
jgi:hypothetical protein